MIDMSGLTVGRLSVLGFAGLTRTGQARWRCRCECDRETLVPGEHLRNGHTRSCGCLRRETASLFLATHGKHKSKIYATWQDMRKRCSDPKAQSYRYYGNLGVRVCKRWQVFENFYADVGDPPPGKTLDRRNPFGDYEPDNWRWATKSEQRLNTRGHFALRMVELLDPAVRQDLYARVAGDVNV